MIFAAKALLDENPDPSEAELKHFMHGNICRCTGYKKIIESIMAAAKDHAIGDVSVPKFYSFKLMNTFRYSKW